MPKYSLRCFGKVPCNAASWKLSKGSKSPSLRRSYHPQSLTLNCRRARQKGRDHSACGDTLVGEVDNRFVRCQPTWYQTDIVNRNLAAHHSPERILIKLLSASPSESPNGLRAIRFSSDADHSGHSAVVQHGGVQLPLFTDGLRRAGLADKWWFDRSHRPFQAGKSLLRAARLGLNKSAGHASSPKASHVWFLACLLVTECGHQFHYDPHQC